MARKIPIIIVTGCLGSGKTTVLNYLLRRTDNTRTAVIVNEFGQEGIDHHLLKVSEEKLSLINSGCMCCNSREDLEQEMKEILFEHETGKKVVDKIIIETTGLADPAPIAFTILNHAVLQNHFKVELTITIVDAKNAQLHFENSPEFIKQISASDSVVITKEDLVTDETKAEVVKNVQSIQPTVNVYHANHGEVNVDVLDKPSANSHLFDLHTTEANVPLHDMSQQVNSISFYFTTALNWTAFTLWLSLLLHTHGKNVLRVKGILDVGEETPVNLNGVQHIIHPPEHLDAWPQDVSHSFLVFIVKDIDTLSILRSLETFQRYIGSDVKLLEINNSL